MLGMFCCKCNKLATMFVKNLTGNDASYCRDCSPEFLMQSDREIRYKMALLRIREWDCLNPPATHLCADLLWLKTLVDDALREPR